MWTWEVLWEHWRGFGDLEWDTQTLRELWEHWEGHWEYWGGIREFEGLWRHGGAASPDLSFHPLDLLLQLFGDHLPPEGKGQGWRYGGTP